MLRHLNYFFRADKGGGVTRLPGRRKMFDFDYQLSILPRQPGVYIMKNSLGEIIYIGKAKILRNRVKSYFKNTNQHSVKTRHLVSNIAEFEFIVTDSEIESLILEQNLIKENMPKYNINLKDDKRFPFIKVTVKDDFPKIFMTRVMEKDGSRYFGPYTDLGSMYETLEAIKKAYPIRTCNRIITVDSAPTKPCLNYHMGLCSAPCAKFISKEEYGKYIDDVIEPRNTRFRIIRALRQLENKQLTLPAKKHDNIPL